MSHQQLRIQQQHQQQHLTHYTHRLHSNQLHHIPTTSLLKISIVQSIRRGSLVSLAIRPLPAILNYHSQKMTTTTKM